MNRHLFRSGAEQGCPEAAEKSRQTHRRLPFFAVLQNSVIQLCVALERLGCNAMPEEIADYCGTSIEEVYTLKKGIHGILVDADTGRFWIK
ncbi:MAG: hypothetical protein HKN23_15085 [Verrucomicrobiales bacterium]|nr:hypothetical protein [Verrucomicrobiales bacterium]